MEELHQQKVKHVIKSAEGSAGLVHKNTKPTAWRGGTQILKREEEDSRLLDRCEAKWKEWAKHRQCEESVQTLEDKPWENEELKKLEEALPRLKERWGKSCQDCTRRKQELDAMVSTQQSLWILQKKQEEKSWSSWRKWSRVGKWPQQACTTMFLIPKNVTSERPVALMPTLIRWWEALRASEVAKWQQKYCVDWDATDGRNGGGQRTVWEVLMKMERYKFCAGEEGWEAVALVLDLAKAFERVSLLVVWAWATHFSFPRKMLRVLCGYFEHQRRVQFEGCAAGPLPTVTAILPGTKWSCLLPRIVLQDALSEVT